VYVSMPAVWTSREWRDEVEAWIHRSVRAAGHRVTGTVEQVRVRVWSTQLTVATTAGRLWFKENHPGQAMEAAVVDELARFAPEHVVLPLAVDRSRGWLLTPDHGDTLATLAATDEDMWCRVVAEFGQMQRRCADHRDDLVAAGLAPLVPAMVAEHVEQQMQRMRRLPPSDLGHVGPDLAERALRAVPILRATAARLADASPQLTSLEHNDLHQNNVFIPRPVETTLRFFDFADAVWAHPFTTLAVPVDRLSQAWETQPDDPRILRVIDSYLEVWSDMGSIAELGEAARLAGTFHPVHRFESWRRILAGGPRAELPEMTGILDYWLNQIADTPPP
jgi:hypothetical protein